MEQKTQIVHLRRASSDRYVWDKEGLKRALRDLREYEEKLEKNECATD